jgi:hypothetical protein
VSLNQPSIPPIGLLVVHGIGNQQPGALSAELANQLADRESPVIVESPLGADGKARDDPGCGLPPACRILVAGRTVLIREAHWAPLSDPGNPPQVRLPGDLVREFIDTVVSAWNRWPVARMLRPMTRRLPSPIGLVLSVMVGILVVGCVLLPAFTQSEAVQMASGVILLLCCIAYTVQTLRCHRLTLRRASRIRQSTCGPLTVLLAPVQLWLLAICAAIVGEMLLLLAIPVIAAALASWLGWVLVRLFVALGRLLNHPATWVLQRWTHWLGWVLVVLPTHSLLQAVKSTANLVSIALTEKDVRARLATVPWFLGVYILSALLFFFCEILSPPILFAVVFFSGGVGSVNSSDAAFLLLGSIVIVPVYLLSVRLSLPAIDLLLDVGNYHLGSARDRKLYHERVEKAVWLLRTAGCREIHVLAHSLGSVITYDWLSAADNGNQSVRVLHTIGSPLNKFWYIDHAHDRRRADAEGHPNILQCHWTNYWAWSDWVSGRLARYAGARVRIADIRLRWLGPVLLSHVRYWKNSAVIAGIRTAIAAATP